MLVFNLEILGDSFATSSQAPSYAGRLQSETMTDLLTGVKCRATSVAKNVLVLVLRSLEIHENNLEIISK